MEIASVMEKLSFQDGITVNSIKLEILDEAGNTVQDEQLLPAMYLFGVFEEMAEIEAVTVTPEGSNIGVNIGIDKFHDSTSFRIVLNRLYSS